MKQPNRVYDQKMPQSHTLDQCGHEEEAKNNNSHTKKTIKMKQTALFPSEMITVRI